MVMILASEVLKKYDVPFYQEKVKDIEKNIISEAKKGFSRYSFGGANIPAERLRAIAAVMRLYGYDAHVNDTGALPSITISWEEPKDHGEVMETGLPEA